MIPFIVCCLAALYGVVAYAWIATFHVVRDEPMPARERVGLSIVFGVLLLAIANNYLTPLVGSIWSAAVLLTAPVCHVLVIVSRKQLRSAFRELRPTAWQDLASAAACVLFILLIASKLFFWRFLAAYGVLYPDLPWHIGRAAEQAFQSSPGFWPLSPLAFPGRLPFVSFVADALVSASFRYVPTPIHAFTYSQALFCWSIVLWIAVALVAGSGAWRSLVVLITALLAVPAFLFGVSQVGRILFVFFHANPNSLVAWPVGLVLTFHLYHSFLRRTPPSLLALLLIPPASLFVKANQAFAFGFLQAVGFGIWLWRERSADVWASGMIAGAIWAIAIEASFAMGSWPPSGGIHASLANFQHYAQVALGFQSRRLVAGHWLLYVLAAAVVSGASLMLRGNRIIGRELIAPLVVLVAAMAYLIAGWVMVVPNGLAEGEPMHVNFELIMWIFTVIVASSLGDMFGRSVSMPVAASGSFAVLGFCAFMVWTLNERPVERGGIPLVHRYDFALELAVRHQTVTIIPDGHCFWYKRWFAIDVGGQLDPDAVIAATGCPVINGKRWRGYLGTNDPEQIRQQPSIAVPQTEGFTLVPVS